MHGLFLGFIVILYALDPRTERVREKTADPCPRSTVTAVHATLGETSMFVVHILHSADLGLTAALLNNRTKTLLLYDFIIQSVKYCSNNHDLDDIFTNTSTCVNTNYWLPVHWKVGGWKKKSLFYEPAISRLPQLFGQDFVINFSTYTRVYGNYFEH